MSGLGEITIAGVEPFDAIGEVYDNLFTNSAIGSAQRRSVWTELDRNFRPGQRILEINCGTGVDALHLAGRGIRVVACDSSSGMIAAARRRWEASPHRDGVDLRHLAIEHIIRLEGEGPYDGIVSNFAGLNCLPDLKQVAANLARLVSPGAKAILCLFGRLCLWEVLWYLAQGHFEKAFRRLRPQGVVATLAAGGQVLIRYPAVRSLQEEFSPYFRLKSWKGVGVAVPPSYLEFFPARFPRLFRWAVEIDPFLGRCPGFRALADHVVVALERSET
jgi:SAM-dependent methyltransferase